MKLPKKLMCQKCDAFIQSYVPNFCDDVAESWPSDEQMNRRLSTSVYTCERPWDQEKYCAAKARREQRRRCKQIYKLLGQHKKTLIDADLVTETLLQPPCDAPTVAHGNHRNENNLSSDLPYAITALEQLANTTITDASTKNAFEESPRRRCFGWFGKKYDRLFQQGVKGACPLQGITMATTGVVDIPDQFSLHRVYNSIRGSNQLVFCKDVNLGSYVLRSRKCDGTAAGDNSLLCEKCVLLSQFTNAVVKKAKTIEKDTHKDIFFTEDRINAMMGAAPAELDISSMAAETVPDADAAFLEDENVTITDASTKSAIEENPRRRCFGFYGTEYDLIFQQALKSVSPLRCITMETTGVVKIPDHFPLHRVYNSIGGASELTFCKDTDLGSYVLRSSKCDGTAAGPFELLCVKCKPHVRTTTAVAMKAKAIEQDNNEGINLTEDRVNVMSDAATLKLVQKMRKEREVNARNTKKRIMRGLEKAPKKTKHSDDLKIPRCSSALDSMLPQIRMRDHNVPG
jgi:hypothetical protein